MQKRFSFNRWGSFDILTLLIVLGATFLLAQMIYSAPRLAVFTVDTPSRLLPRSGFYDSEQFPGQARRYRWTQGSAHMTLPNPGGALIVRLVLAGGPERSVPVQLRADDQIMAFTVAPSPRIYMAVLPQSQREHVALQIDSPVLHAASDRRELGVIVSDLQLAGGRTAPGTIVLLLMLAALGLYLFLRLITQRRIVAASVVVLLQALVLVWHASDGWRAGSLNRMLLGGGTILGVLLAAVWIPRLIAPQAVPASAWTARRFFPRPINRLLESAAVAPKIELLRRAYLFWRRNSKLPVLVLLATTAVSLQCIRVKTQFTAQDFGLDPSWFLELEYQLRLGHLLGRDTYFTYGPLSQVIMSLGSFLRGGGSVLRGFSTGYLMFEIAGVALVVLALLLIPQVRWDGALFIFSVCFLLDGIINMRQGMSLLSMIVLVRALDARAAWRRWPSVLVGLLWFMGQLITTDTLIYSVIAASGLLLICALLALPRLQRWSVGRNLLSPCLYVKTLAISLATLIACNIAMEIFFQLSSPEYHLFDYFRYTFAILTAYNYALGQHWQLGQLSSLIILMVFLYNIICIFTHFKGARREIFHLTVGLCIASIVNFKSALVRSSVGHIMLSSTILVFLFLLILYLNTNKRLFQPLGLLLLVLVMITWPSNLSGTLQLLPRLAFGELSIAEKWQAVRAITVNPQDVAPPELRAATDPNKQLVNFPYDNVLAIALNQRSLAPILQTYAANNLQLQQKYVQDIARHHSNVEIIYGIDGMSVGGIDDVQNVTRVPVIFKYIAENFRLKTDRLFKNGYMVLVPREQPKALSSSPLMYETRNTGNRMTLSLQQPASCALVEVDIAINYPITALIGRPRGLLAQVRDGDNTVVNNAIVALEKGKVFSTLLYLGRPAEFYHLFGDRYSPELNTSFDSISLSAPSYSLFDIHPGSVAVEGLRCVQQAIPQP